MFNTIKVNNTDTNYTHSIFDISDYNSGATYDDLSAALAAVPQNKKQGGMSVKFIQQVPASYSVVKTENLETEPTGTLLSEAPYIDSGIYDESQLSTIFNTLPSETGAGNALTYYVAVTVDETTTYTSWVITKVQNSDNKYVQFRLMSDSFNTNVANWQGVDKEPSLNSENLVESGKVALHLDFLEDKVGTFDEVNSTWNRGVIHATGVIMDTELYKYTDPIHVTSGQKICIKTSGNNFLVISKLVDNRYISIVSSSTQQDPSIVHTYNYTFTEELDVYLCVRTASPQYAAYFITNEPTFVSKTEVEDNLTSTSSEKVLSANQGRILNNTQLDFENMDILESGTFSETIGSVISKTNDTTRARLKKKLKTPFKIKVKEGYVIRAAFYVDKNDIIIATPSLNSRSFTADPSISDYAYINITKNDSTQEITDFNLLEEAICTNNMSLNNRLTNIEKSDFIILSQWRESPILNLDTYAYNTVDSHVWYKDTEGTLTRLSRNPNKIYCYRDTFYKFIGEKLVSINSIGSYIGYVPVLTNASFGVTADNKGMLVPSSTRVACSDFIPIECFNSICPNSGYNVAVYAYKQDNEIIENALGADIINNQLWSNVEITKNDVINKYPTAAFVRFSFKTSDNQELPATLGELNNDVILSVLSQNFNSIFVLNFEHGGLSINDGNIKSASDDNAGFASTYRTPKPIAVLFEDFEIEDVNNTATEIKIFQYDSELEYITSSNYTNSFAFKDSCSYFKVQVISSTKPPLIKLKCNYRDSKLKESFNRSTGLDEINFMVEGQKDFNDDVLSNNDTTMVQVQTTVESTTGLLMLPPNYDPNGTPVRLFIFIQGSGDYTTRYTTRFSTTTGYHPYFEWLRDEGYAIMSTFGWLGCTINIANLIGCQENMNCIHAVYNWVIKNYNIRRDGVFVSCKSLGGIAATALCYDKAIPVLACGELAPAVSAVGYNINLGYSEASRRAYATSMYFEDVVVDGRTITIDCVSDTSTADFKAYMLGNIDKIRNIDPYFHGLTHEQSFALADEMYRYRYSESVYLLPRICNVPLKIWYSDDDGNSFIPRTCFYMLKGIKEAGYQAFIRKMPNGTGGHHSVDTDENARKINLVTKLGYSHENIPLAWAEMLSFCRQYE